MFCYQKKSQINETFLFANSEVIIGGFRKEKLYLARPERH